MPRFALLLCLLLSFDADAAAEPIRLHVDASDVERNIQRVRERIPVGAGPLTLHYPQWIPGNHAPTGPINQIAGLRVEADGRALPWRRDAVDMYAFHLDVPAGVEAIEVAFEYFSPTAREQGRIATTTQLLSLQWHRVLMYPAGSTARDVRMAAELVLPPQWSHASALDGRTGADGRITFAETSLETLVDSPVYAGRHFRRFALDAASPRPVYLNVVADAAELLDAKPAVLDAHRALVTQADRVFGPRPFAHYDFLLAASDRFSGIGLEHLQSSENGQHAGYLLGEPPFTDNDLLAHEYVHAWNGKSHRPLPSRTDHYNTPMRNDLLWVYEGQTNYWSLVLSARAGLWTPEQTRAVLAVVAAGAEQRAGRRWRNLQDTVSEGIIEFNDAPQAWENWQRAFDFYAEGNLLWLDVDARLRELSRGRRSLDDFARAFFVNAAAADGTVSTYEEADVAAALTRLQPGEDWARFLRERLDSHDGDALGGLTRSGWKLAYDAEPNAAVTDAEAAQGLRDFSHSLGIKIANDDGRLTDVLWESPAWHAGLARDTRVIAVEGSAYNGERLQRALVAAQRNAAPIRLLVRQGEDFRTVEIAYHDGPRHPHLVRLDGVPDRLSAILAPRR